MTALGIVNRPRAARAERGPLTLTSPLSQASDPRRSNTLKSFIDTRALTLWGR